MSAESLAVLCLLLFLDGATFAFSSTVLLLHYGKFLPPWQVAVAGGAASALGSAIQLMVLRWLLSSDKPWMRRFTPSRAKVQSTLASYPSASFLALAVARATPLPDAPLKIVAAVIGYPIVLYALASYLGSLPYYYALALIGSRVRIPLWILGVALVVVVTAALLDRWRKRHRKAA